MAGNRRYRVGDQPIYDRLYDRSIARSVILSPEKATIHNTGIAGMLMTESGLQALLKQCTEQLEAAEGAIKAVGADFKRHQQQMVNSGRRAPKEMSAELIERKLRAEATCDVIKVEIQHLEKRLKTFQDQRATTQVKAILKNGPRGSGRLQGGVLVELDGQAIKQNGNGLVIDCERSPYNGLDTITYFERIVPEWNRRTREWLTERHRLARETETPVADIVLPIPAWPTIEGMKNDNSKG
jgi:hypothetical protein